VLRELARERLCRPPGGTIQIVNKRFDRGMISDGVVDRFARSFRRDRARQAGAAFKGRDHFLNRGPTEIKQLFAPGAPDTSAGLGRFYVIRAGAATAFAGAP